MKRRVRKIVNFFAFNLLFFALYLNFIHKDNVAAANVSPDNQGNTAAFSGTIVVENPEQLNQKKNDANAQVATQQQSTTEEKKAEQEKVQPLRLSLN